MVGGNGKGKERENGAEESQIQRDEMEMSGEFVSVDRLLLLLLLIIVVVVVVVITD